MRASRRAEVIARRCGRAALTLVLAVALVPLPSFGEGAISVALAAAPLVPYESLLAYPANPTSVRAPSGVVVAPDGDVIIADTGNDRIKIMSSAGVLKTSIGSKGSALGHFLAPAAVALGADNFIYVADTGNSRIQVFQRDGSFVRSWGSLGTGNGQFSSPRGITVGSDGRVYVTDSGNARVQVFSGTGVFSEKWGSYGDSAAGQFYLPTGIAVDSSGNVYVVDTNKHLVRKYNPTVRTSYTEWGWTTDGTIYTSRYSNPVGIAIAGDGNGLIIADLGNCRIERCTTAGALISSWGGLPASNAVGSFNKPSAAAVGTDGTLVVADTKADRIQRRTAAGVWLTPWSTPSSSTPYVSAPEAVAADPNTGVSYIADTGNSRILKYDATGAFLGSVAESGTGLGQVSSPKGLLVLGDGTLLVSDTGNNRLQRFSSGGAYLGSFGQGYVAGPRALAVSDLGVLFVADTGNNRVAKFSTATWKYQSMIGSTTAGSGDGEFNAPRGVAVLGNSLYVADTGNNRIQKLSASNGTMLAKVGSYGNAAGQFIQPASILVEGGEVLVADTTNDRLQRFDTILSPTPVAVYDGSDTLIGGMSEPAYLAAGVGGRTLVAERKGCQVQVLLRDILPPVTTISGVPDVLSREVILTFTAIDLGSGPATTYVREDGVTRAVTGGSMTFTTEGSHSVAVWSVDRTGNIEAEQTVTFTIDSTPPTGTMQVAGGAALTATDTVDISSAVVGASTMRLSADGASAEWVTYSDSAKLQLSATEGVHTVNADYADEAGNVLQLSHDIVLDTVGPDVAGLDSPTHLLGIPVAGSIQLTWDAASDAAGVAGYAVSVDEDPLGVPPLVIATTGTTHTLPAQPAGTWYVHVAARDNAGNWGSVSHRAIISAQPDLDPPHSQATGVPQSDSQADVTITLSATDSGSGVAGIFYKRDGGVETRFGDALTFTDEGPHTLVFFARDFAGNEESEQTVGFTIDRTAPTGTMQIEAGAAYTKHTQVGVSSAVTGASAMRLSVDGASAEWQTYLDSTELVLPATEGSHTIDADYRDAAGNVLSLTDEIVLDSIGPAVTGLTSPTHALGVPTWGSIGVSWTAPSDRSGIAGYAVSMDADPLGTPPLTVSTTQVSQVFAARPTGTWYIHVAACDNAGNWGAVSHRAISALSDLDAPTTRMFVSSSTPTSRTVAITLQVDDAVSGSGGASFRRNGGAEERYDAPVVFMDEGSYTFDYWSVDRAGNREAERQFAFVIDRTNPTVIRPQYTTYRPVGPQLVVWGTKPDVTGIAGYSVVLSSDARVTPPTKVTTLTPRCEIPRNASGPLYVHIRAVDGAGNWSATTTFDASRRPVGMSRPVVTRDRRTASYVLFSVTGSIASPEATGTVRIVIDRMVGGVWVCDRVIERVPLVADPINRCARYRVARQMIRVPSSSSSGVQVRARAYWAGNATTLPATSVYSASCRLR